MKTRLLIVIAVMAPAIAGIGSRIAAQEKTWVGESVLHTKRAKDIKFGDRVDGKEVWFTFSGRTPIKVREERESRLRIHDGRQEGWVDKSDFVLVRDAPAFFDRRVQANPKDAFALLMRGEGWLEKGEPDKAIQDFNECIRLDPTDSAAFNHRGRAWDAKKEYDKAIKDYDEAIRLDPKDAVAFYNRGHAWDAKKEYDKAIKDYNEAIRLGLKDARAFRSRGLTWYDKREYGKAIKDYDEAIRLDPKYAFAFIDRGRAWDAKQEYDKAIKDYDEAIRLDPKDAIAFHSRGLAWYDKQEYDKAIKDYNEAIRLEPKDARAFFNRGNAWYAKKEYDKAIRDYDEAIRLDSKFALAFYSRALAWDDKKAYDKAIKDYDEAIRLDPKDAFAQFNRSVTRMLMRRAEAAGGFWAVLELEGWKGDRALYAVILGHFAARQAGDEARAERFLKDSAGKLAETWPYPAVKFLRGEIDEPALLKLADNDDKRTEARCYLGLDHALKSRKKEALAHFRWVKEYGNASYTEYRIAVAELDRLSRPSEKSKR